MKNNIRKYAKVVLASVLSLAFVLQAFNGLSFASEETTETGYKELAFGDWGTSVGTFEGSNIYSLTDTTITSLDGVAISGKVNFNNSAWLRIGGTESVKHGGVWFGSNPNGLYMIPQGIGGDGSSHAFPVPAAEWETLKSTEITLRVTFDKAADGSAWTVGVFVNGADKGSYTFNGITPGLYIGIDPAVTVDMTPSTSGTGYTELAFGDWGTSVGTFEGSNIYSLTDTTITSLDGVAISGKVNFNNSAWLRIGGTESVKHGGVWFGSNPNGLYMIPQGIGGDGNSHAFPVPAAEWETLKSTEITLRVTFDKAADGSAWTVGVFVNGADKGSYTFNGITPGLYIGIDPAVTVDMTTSEPDTPDEPTYTELAFSDWSTSVGVVEGSNIYSLAGHDDITSLDGVAISGKVNFNGSSWLRIGGTESVKHGGVWFSGSNANGLYMTPQGIGGSGDYFPVTAVEWDELKNTEITLRLTFDKAEDGSSWTVGVFVNEADKGSYTIEGLNPGLYIGVDPAVTVDMTTDTPDTPEEPTYTELAFSDWSTSVGVVEGSNIYSLTGHDDITSLDGVAITGKVNFNGSYWLRVGGTESVKHGGVWFSGSNANGLYMTPQGIGGSGDYFPVTAEEWDELKNTEITLRLTFDKAEDGSSWTVGVFVNEADKGSYTIEGLNPGLYIGVDPTVTVDMTTGTPDTPDIPDEPDDSKTYTDFTFSDWGILDGEYISAYAYDLANGLTSLDGTAFNGVLKFNGTPRWLRIGAPNGWEGLLLTVRENTLIIDSEISGFNTLDNILSYTEKNLLTEEFKLRLTFDFDADNNVKLGVWIDDEFQRYLTYKGMATAMGTKLLIDEAGVTIADVGTKDEETDTTPTEKATLPENLTEVTFESFGIEDGTYKYNGNLLAAEGQYARPLGSSIFSGDFYIPSGSNVDFRYGGVSANWFGLIFANTADGKLYMEGIADDVKVTNSYVFNPAKAGTEFIDTSFNLKLTTEIVDSDSDGAKDDVKLGVWFNDVLYNNKYIELQDYAQYLGNRVGVYVRDADSSVKLKSDTTVYMGVDFTLFGFTRNWEKELGLK